MRLPLSRRTPGQPLPRSFLLGAAAGVIALVFAVAGGALSWQKYADSRDSLERDLGLQAAARATYLDQFVLARLSTLRAVSLTPEVAAGDVAALQAYFHDLPHDDLGFSNGIGWVSPDGYAVASSSFPVEAEPIWVADRDYYRGVMATGAPQVTPALIGRASSAPLITLATPSFRADGSLSGMVVGGLVLSDAQTFDSLVRDGRRLRVIDSAGQVIIDNGPVGALVSVEGSRLYRRALSEGAGMLSDFANLDGERGSMVGFAAVPAAGWTVVLERDRGAALAPARRTLAAELTLIGIVALAAIVAAAAVGRSLDRQAWALEQSLAAKDEFLGLVSHELRTPLTQVLGNAEALLRKHPPMPEDVRRESYEEIHRQGTRLRRIVENMLVLSRLESGRAGELEPSLVQRLLPGVARQFTDQFGWTRLEIRIQDDLPPVEVNATAFEQVVWNLLTNAAKYGASGSPIELEAALVDGWVAIAVRDNGPGVPEDELPRLFEPYFRSRTVPTHSSGLGLGLSVCKRLVELQGGEMYVRQRPVGGMEFGMRHRPVTADDEDRREAAHSERVAVAQLR